MRPHSAPPIAHHARHPLEATRPVNAAAAAVRSLPRGARRAAALLRGVLLPRVGEGCPLVGRLFTLLSVCEYIVRRERRDAGSSAAGNSSGWKSVHPPSSALARQPARVIASRTRLEVRRSSQPASSCHATSPAQQRAASRGSSASGLPNRMRSSPPRARSEARRAVTAARSARAA